METILLLLNLNQVLSGEISGNDFNPNNFGFVATYETTSECNDALIKVISTEPENPDNWTVVFNNGSAAATSDEFAILICAPKLSDVYQSLALSRSTPNAENADTTQTDGVSQSIEKAFERAEAEALALEDLEAEKELEGQILDALALEKAFANALDTMTNRITRSWRRPNSYQSGLEVYLRMSLSPDGSLENVKVMRPSGNEQFDNSAIDAVKNASPFNEVQQFDASVFEERFKTLTVKFRPED